MIKLEIGFPVHQATHSARYEIVVTLMHGDADMYDLEKVFFENEDDVITTLEILDAAKSCDNGQSLKQTHDVIRARMEKLGLDADEALDWFGNFVPYDKLYEGSGNLAHVDDYEVFWWTTDGVKKNVRVLWGEE